MLIDLFGESALKGIRVRPSINNNPVRLDESINVNYMCSEYTNDDETNFYSTVDPPKKYKGSLSSMGYDFIIDVYGHLRVRSRYKEVSYLLFYFLFILFTNISLYTVVY